MRHTICLMLILTASCCLHAHSDPRGDIHPQVIVEDGSFVICFSNNDDVNLDYRPSWKMSFTTDGKVILPRYRIAAEQRDLWERRLAAEGSWEVTTDSHGGQNASRFFLKEHMSGKQRSYPMPLEPTKAWYSANACRAGNEVVFTWSEPRMNYEEEVVMMFSSASLNSFTPGITVEIGKPATIYDAPRVSNPVWAAKKWWIAWVRAGPGDENGEWSKIAWQTVMTSIDPITGKCEHEVLPELSHWNTHLSMKTAGGWLCAAWHASVDGSYPGRARIVIAFKKLPE